MWPWIIGIVAVLVGLPMLLAVIGLFLPRDHVAIVAATYAAGAERLFDAITDHETHPTWRTGLKRVQRGPDHEGKPVWIEDTPQGPMPIAEMERDRPRRLVGKVVDAGLPFGGTWTFDLSPAGTGTRITITEAGFVKPLIFRTVGRLMSMTKAPSSYLRDLGRHVGETVTVEVVRAR